MNWSHSSSSEREREPGERACWLQTDIWLLNPQATVVTVQAGLSPSFCGRSKSLLLCATVCFFPLRFLHLESWRSTLKVLGVVYLKQVLECAYRGGKAWQLDSLTLFLVFLPLSEDCCWKSPSKHWNLDLLVLHSLTTANYFCSTNFLCARPGLFFTKEMVF